MKGLQPKTPLVQPPTEDAARPDERALRPTLLTPAEAVALCDQGMRMRCEIEARYAEMRRAAWAMV